MLDAVSEIDVNAPADFVFRVLWDVARYPEFLTDVVETVVCPDADGHVQVANFEVQLVRIRRYSLRMVAESAVRIHWTLVTGDSLSQNEGGWDVTPHQDGRSCTIVYRLGIAFTVPVPDVIVRKMIAHNLPMMLRQFKVRAEQLHRRELANGG